MLQSQVRSHDIAARMGGDEFAVLLPKVDEANARMVAERIVKGIAAIPGAWRISASAGVAIISGATEDEETAIRQADSALYFVKGTGKNRIHVFGSEDPAPRPAGGAIMSASSPST